MSRDELKDLMRDSVVGASMLSRQIGVSRSTVYRWLDGEAPISKMAEIAIRSVIKDIRLKL
jgi:DNA-binding transcriptional regulator YdaS (Cro superfamily)